MITLGLIGGIGSGKSTVAAMFRQLGAVVIDADAIGHDVLRLPEVKTALRSRWGTDVISSDGEPDRRQIANIVFQRDERGEQELNWLQTLTHPLIDREIETRVKALNISGERVVVLDIPLLLEAKWDTEVDKIVFVDAPQQLRMQRVLRRGWTQSEFESRESAQLPVAEKRLRADWILRNDETEESTLDQVRKIWQNLGQVENETSARM